MKKILSLLLALGLCFGLTGCSDEDTKPKENNTKDEINEDKQDEKKMTKKMKLKYMALEKLLHILKMVKI